LGISYKCLSNFRYSNGDVYEGAFRDGQRHGHGTYRHGQHNSMAASVYIGEWVSDKKQGYGIMDDVMKGKLISYPAQINV
jgi:amyotrophic lateral sclerosis 2 protein